MIEEPKHAIPLVNWGDQEESESVLKWTSWARSLLEEAETPGSINGVVVYGQDLVKNQIRPFLDRKERFPHTLILGLPGIGKSHFARWIAGERKEPFIELMAPLRTTESLPTVGIVLLDEVHRQSRPEWLFPLMERSMTLLAATTRPEMIEPAFLSRFFLTLTLDPLDQGASEDLITALLGEGDHVPILARATAGNPRQAHQIAETAKGLGTTDPETVLSTVRINGDGLRDLHMKYLKTLKRLGRPTGANQLAILLSTNEQTIKEHERLLLELELIDLSSSGRILTRKGHRYTELLG